jgi:hypothetical protein
MLQALTRTAALAAVIATGSLFGTPIPVSNGAILQLSNLQTQLVALNNMCINWGTPAPCQTITGVGDTVSGSDNTVFTVGSGAANGDTILDLPAGVATPLVGFETVQSPLPGGIVTFDLINIVVPASPAVNNCTAFALGAVCSPGGGSPFLLVQTSTIQVSISFSLNAIAYTGSSATGSTPYNAIFTTQLSGTLPNGAAVTIPNILFFIAGGGTITTTWSATESPAAQQTTLCPQSFQVRYASNLNIGESFVDITNTGANGAPLLGPGFGGATGNICVNVYAFDPAEELISCCSCLVTPDQTVNLGVNRDLTVKTLTGTVPTSVTIKLLPVLAGSGGSGTNCTNTAATSATPVDGLAAWGTTLHFNGSAGAYDATETPFTPSCLSTGEQNSIIGRCAAITGNGSGFGICSSCRAGALGGTRLAN